MLKRGIKALFVLIPKVYLFLTILSYLLRMHGNVKLLPPFMHPVSVWCSSVNLV